MKVHDVVIQEKAYQLVSDFKEDALMRERFYELPETFFGVDFKAWYDAGYWGAWYNPYCLLNHGKVVSNVGVAKQQFLLDGKEIKLIQLGSVGTWKAYRNKGLSRYLIEHIIEEYKNQCDAIFLFGNDNVLKFYPKFGFQKVQEHRYVTDVIKLDIDSIGRGIEYTVRKLDCTNENDRQLVKEKVKHYNQYAQFTIVNHVELLCLYWEICKAIELYYIEALDTIAIASYAEGSLTIDEVYGEAPLDEVIKALCKEQRTKVILGFKPKATDKYSIEIFHKPDTTLFIYGEMFKERFRQEQLRFPMVSHT